MELIRIYGEFDSQELAELAGGRIRRAVRGIRRMTVCPLSGSRQPVGGRIRFTMLPTNLCANPCMTDVLYSEISSRAIPEPMCRQEAELMVLCDESAGSRVTMLLHAAGAMRVRQN